MPAVLLDPRVRADLGPPPPSVARGHTAAVAAVPPGGSPRAGGRRLPRLIRALRADRGRGIALASEPGMDARQAGAAGHYGALGVAPTATPRQVEQAFRLWGERLASGEEGLDAYRRAESAYHVLAIPDSRARHDRQLGLLGHPAWRTKQDRVSRAWVRAALQELERGGAERALELLRRATSRVPDDPQARSYLALALVRAGGSLHEAAGHARYAAERQPEEPAFHFNLAEVYAAAGLRARALGTRARGWQAVLAALLNSGRRM